MTPGLTSLLLVTAFVTSPVSSTQPAGRSKDDIHQGRITLKTTQTGFPIPAGQVIRDYPLLVRFDGDQFPWDEANPDGSDVTFETDAQRSLPVSIEEWNPKAKRAAIWVRIPLISGGDRQTLIVKWGKSPNHQRVTGPVFDTSNGFASVLHLGDESIDVLGTLSLRPDGTGTTPGAIGNASRFSQGTGIAGTLQNGKSLPAGSQASTTSAWVRVRKSNGTMVGWGQEAAQGKVVMQFRSPAHINMDCYFSDASIKSVSKAPIGEWMHVSHVYTKGETKLYINGRLEATNTGKGAPLAIAK
jgi:biopolymer transport protein ExbB